MWPCSCRRERWYWTQGCMLRPNLCAFYGRTSGTSTTFIVRKKSSSTGPCVVPLNLAVAMRKQENMPCVCPIPGCSATVWVPNIKTHLASCHPTVAPNTVELME